MYSKQSHSAFSFESREVVCLASTTLHDWLKKLVPRFHPIRSKTKPNWFPLAHVFPRFTSAAWNSSYDWFPGYLCPLWLATVITLVLVVRHAIENRSMWYCVQMARTGVWMMKSSVDWWKMLLTASHMRCWRCPGPGQCRLHEVLLYSPVSTEPATFVRVVAKQQDRICWRNTFRSSYCWIPKRKIIRFCCISVF